MEVLVNQRNASSLRFLTSCNTSYNIQMNQKQKPQIINSGGSSKTGRNTPPNTMQCWCRSGSHLLSAANRADPQTVYMVWSDGYPQTSQCSPHLKTPGSAPPGVRLDKFGREQRQAFSTPVVVSIAQINVIRTATLNYAGEGRQRPHDCEENS